MATTAQMRGIVTEPEWQFRVGYFVTKAAVAVMAEDDQTANHANRLAYAKKVLASTVSLAQWYPAVLTNSTIAASANPMATTDNDMEFTINSMFDAFATAGA